MVTSREWAITDGQTTYRPMASSPPVEPYSCRAHRHTSSASISENAVVTMRARNRASGRSVDHGRPYRTALNAVTGILLSCSRVLSPVSTEAP